MPLEALAIDLTVMRVARAARMRDLQRLRPSQDEFGIGTITLLLSMLVEA